MTDSETFPFTLADGVSARLMTLEQTRTYAGLLEGVPNTELNTRMIEEASEGIDYVLPPEVQPLKVNLHSSLGKAEALPGVQITARFSSFTARNEDDLGSLLSLVWWQDDFIEHLGQELNAVTGRVPWWDHAQVWDP